MKFLNLFKRKTSSINNGYLEEKQVVRRIEEVKCGETINFNCLQTNNLVTIMTNLNNNVEERKLFFRIDYVNSRSENWVESYDHHFFRNFATINPIIKHTVKRDKKQSIPDGLSKMLKDCYNSGCFEDKKGICYRNVSSVTDNKFELGLTSKGQIFNY